MRYFHRTALSADAATRARSFSGTIGRVTIRVTAEGGHYTLVTVETDQVGESEADKLAKRFLAVVHQRLEPGHALRGAY